MAQIYNAYIIIQKAAYASARAGVVHNGDQAIINQAARAVGQTLTREPGRIRAEVATMGNDLRVKVTYRMPLVFPLPIKKLLTEMPISASCLMKMEVPENQ